MRFIGVDLAWGEKSSTGLCAVSEEGRILDSATRVALDDVVLWCEDHIEDDVLVAVDAPVVVTNASGRRACERVISRCYGGRNASTHSSNTSMTAFARGTRAARLAVRLALDINPQIVPKMPTRRLIEVYPHPAIVTFGGLASALPYKSKAGRSLAVRLASFDQLMSLLEGLATAEPPLDVAAHDQWRLLRLAIGSANSAKLSAIEDEVDAYVCAYIGLYYWHHGLSRCRVVGNLAGGYIVTPVSAVDAATIDNLAVLLNT